MKIKTGPLFGFIAIAAALVLGGMSFVKNLTPYLPFATARQTTGVVQVMGKLDKSSIRSDGPNLYFTLVEPKTGDRMDVVFGHTRPANFELALEITAIGRFEGGSFKADNLLVKCPSKYQGTETKSYGAK